MIRFIVDEEPKKPYDCPFYNMQTGLCTLDATTTDKRCGLNTIVEKCGLVVSIKEYCEVTE